jgi:hypothetical protein
VVAWDGKSAVYVKVAEKGEGNRLYTKTVGGEAGASP